MRRDVSSTTPLGISIQPVKHSLQWSSQSRRTRFHGFEHVAIARKNAHHVRQRIGVPIRAKVGFATANRASKSHFRVKLLICHGDGRDQVRVAIAEVILVAPVDKCQTAVLQYAQALQDRPSCQHVEM